MPIRDLAPSDLASPRFLELLRLAAELPEEELVRLRDEELPALTVIGVFEDGRLDAFAAARPVEEGLEIEYVASLVRGRGSALVRELQRTHTGAAIIARTDDDAIGFYRRLGFTEAPAPVDPRWPDRPRYRCSLAAAS